MGPLNTNCRYGAIFIVSTSDVGRSSHIGDGFNGGVCYNRGNEI